MHNEQLPTWSKGSFVISEYINNPWLINSKKFDLRIYVLVTKFNPLCAYIYQDGFARFCTENYTLDSREISNTFVHLTNVSMNQLNVHIL
jgi:tubulin polyglutamylase TTLL1